MLYLYKGTVTTVILVENDFVEITSGQLINLPEAPSSDFVLQEKPKNIVSKPLPTPTKRLLKKRTPTKKVVTDGSDS
jgi:hypothetical protein